MGRLAEAGTSQIWGLFDVELKAVERESAPSLAAGSLRSERQVRSIERELRTCWVSLDTAVGQEGHLLGLVVVSLLWSC